MFIKPTRFRSLGFQLQHHFKHHKYAKKYKEKTKELFPHDKIRILKYRDGYDIYLKVNYRYRASSENVEIFDRFVHTLLRQDRDWR